VLRPKDTASVWDPFDTVTLDRSSYTTTGTLSLMLIYLGGSGT